MIILLFFKKTYMFYLQRQNSTKAVTAGGPGFTGYVAGANFIQSALTGSDVVAQYSKETDTRGAPFVKIPEKTITQATDSFGFKCPSFYV
jgi:amino acid transporter